MWVLLVLELIKTVGLDFVWVLIPVSIDVLVIVGLWLWAKKKSKSARWVARRLKLCRSKTG